MFKSFICFFDISCQAPNTFLGVSTPFLHQTTCFGWGLISWGSQLKHKNFLILNPQNANFWTRFLLRKNFSQKRFIVRKPIYTINHHRSPIIVVK